MTKLNYRIEVSPKLRRLLENPTPLVKATMQRADKIALTILQESIKTNAPRRSGKLARSIYIDLADRRVSSNLVYCRAIELGHFAQAKPGHYLRFAGAGQRTGYVFPTMHYKGAKGYADLKGQWYSGVRFKKQPYFFKSINQNKQQIIQTYEDEFKSLLGGV